MAFCSTAYDWEVGKTEGVLVINVKSCCNGRGGVMPIHSRHSSHSGTLRLVESSIFSNDHPLFARSLAFGQLFHLVCLSGYHKRLRTEVNGGFLLHNDARTGSSVSMLIFCFHMIILCRLTVLPCL